MTMTLSTNPILTTVTLATSAVLGGVFVGFTTVVMPGLARMPAREALVAMQAINVAAPRGLLMVPLMGSAVGSVVVGVVGGWQALAGRGEGRWMLLAGAAVGVAAFVVTVAYHVPRNDALGQVDALSSGAAQAWAAYQPGWTALNTVRAGLALVSAALMVAGVVRSAG